MNMPSVPGIAFKLANRADGNYGFETRISVHMEAQSDPISLSSRFATEFTTAKDLLGARLAQEQRANSAHMAHGRVSMAGAGIAAGSFTPLSTYCPIGDDGRPVCPPVSGNGTSTGGGGGGGGMGPGPSEGGNDPCPANVMMPEPCTPEGGGPGSYPGDNEASQTEVADRTAKGLVFPCPKPDETQRAHEARSFLFCRSEVQRAVPFFPDFLADAACIKVKTVIAETYEGHQSCRN